MTSIISIEINGRSIAALIHKTNHKAFFHMRFYL
jgi:hypothetical protein